MKGIILAGGSGSRLYPCTEIITKQLQTVYDKPLIYYPLSTLMMAGIRDICIIVSPKEKQRFENILGDGKGLGISIAYETQEEPNGIAEAFKIPNEEFRKGPVTLILGDNIFHGRMGLASTLSDYNSHATGATIFSYPVKDPERYGVIELDGDRVKALHEKPSNPPTNLAVPGLYVYDETVWDRVHTLTPSSRGELEITDLNNQYLEEGKLSVSNLGRGIAWLDTGTPDSMLDASNYIAAIEHRQGLKVACLEEVAYERGFINRDQLNSLIEGMPKSSYREYLEQRYK